MRVKERAPDPRLVAIVAAAVAPLREQVRQLAETCDEIRQCPTVERRAEP